MKKFPVVRVLTGAGISKESGIPTFRELNGWWNQYKIEEVASPQAWKKNPELVLEFYNMRRRMLKEVQPNEAHRALAELEKYFPTYIITQNVDDLHERAGSKNVLHLHGELKKVRSEKNPRLIYEWEDDLHLGDLAEDRAQLRPHIVWFGEPVPAIEEAQELVREADIFLIVGTSMQVYPAAGLIYSLKPQAEIYYIDPHPAPIQTGNKLHVIPEKAAQAVPELVKNLIEKYA